MVAAKITQSYKEKSYNLFLSSRRDSQEERIASPAHFTHVSIGVVLMG